MNTEDRLDFFLSNEFYIIQQINKLRNRLDDQEYMNFNLMVKKGIRILLAGDEELLEVTKKKPHAEVFEIQDKIGDLFVLDGLGHISQNPYLMNSTNKQVGEVIEILEPNCIKVAPISPEFNADAGDKLLLLCPAFDWLEFIRTVHDTADIIQNHFRSANLEYLFNDRLIEEIKDALVNNKMSEVFFNEKKPVDPDLFKWAFNLKDSDIEDLKKQLTIEDTRSNAEPKISPYYRKFFERHHDIPEDSTEFAELRNMCMRDYEADIKNESNDRYRTIRMLCYYIPGKNKDEYRAKLVGIATDTFKKRRLEMNNPR